MLLLPLLCTEKHVTFGQCLGTEELWDLGLCWSFPGYTEVVLCGLKSDSTLQVCFVWGNGSQATSFSLVSWNFEVCVPWTQICLCNRSPNLQTLGSLKSSIFCGVNFSRSYRKGPVVKNRSRMPKLWCYLTLEKALRFSVCLERHIRMLPQVCLVYKQTFDKDVDFALQVASGLCPFILFICGWVRATVYLPQRSLQVSATWCLCLRTPSPMRGRYSWMGAWFPREVTSSTLAWCSTSRADP